jgi:hypothetical protein
MLTGVLILFLMLLFIGDIVILFKGIDEWKKKIDSAQGPRKNAWLVVFYIISTLLIILTLFYWGKLF